jgi:hypothetical protein
MSEIALRRAGLLCLVAGLLGAASAVVLIAWPPQVDESLVSYPFTSTGFLAVQAFFFVHHLGLLAGVVALALVGPALGGRVSRAGAWIAVLGTAGLAGAELLAMRYAEWDFDEANAGLMGTTYGITSTLIGIGMIMAGVGVVRARVWTGWERWTPLVIGVAEFVMLTPGLFGGFVLARVVIGTWMLMFAALGWSLYDQHRAGRKSAGPRVRAAPRQA